MALGEVQDEVSRMPDQATTGLERSLLEAGQRPALDGERQDEPVGRRGRAAAPARGSRAAPASWAVSVWEFGEASGSETGCSGLSGRKELKAKNAPARGCDVEPLADADGRRFEHDQAVGSARAAVAYAHVILGRRFSSEPESAALRRHDDGA
jgi:hypothetical protein